MEECTVGRMMNEASGLVRFLQNCPLLDAMSDNETRFDLLKVKSSDKIMSLGFFVCHFEIGEPKSSSIISK